ncbi:carboxylesterase family protein [Streptomyces sp. ODS28]|uniref:carboxylesterase/lipase family protein n=1 Tax=Streptomyces sp. ODS28 TaxID=3136688 RepID=UPI0031F11EF6
MATDDAPEVRIAAGRLRGRSEEGVAVFRGIPFAEPPVGALRFAAPRPARGWDGVREARDFGPPPPQAASMAEVPAVQPESDDWLTVNVWSPDPAPGAGLPVMVWIYGGAYQNGSSSSPGYDGALLAREGPAVVVTLNYRVGVEGFAHLEDAPANRGLLDQIAALEWVRDNVRAFGGDPARVTVFGESAGAGSIAALLATERAAGLFRRAVLQSVPGTYFSAGLAADIGAAIAGELGLRPTAADLSTVPPGRLPAAGDAIAAKMRQHEARWGAVAHTPTPFSPVVDGELLSRTPWEAVADGAARDVALLTGHTRDEYRLFLAWEGLPVTVSEERADTALRVFAPGPDGPRRYREGFPGAGPAELCEVVQSDWLFRMPTLALARAQSEAGGSAHLYELTWPAPAYDGAFGACHALDVPLTFGTLDADIALLLLGDASNAGARELSAYIRRAWTRFATEGTPGWPAYDTTDHHTQLLDTPPTLAPYPETTSRALWEHHAFGPLPLLAE